MENKKLREHLVVIMEKEHDTRLTIDEQRAMEKEKKETENFAELLRDRFRLPFTPALTEPRLMIDPERKIFIEYEGRHGRGSIAVGFECPKCKTTHVTRYGIQVNEMHDHIERIKTFVDAGIPDQKLASRHNYPSCLHPPIQTVDAWQYDLVEKLADVIDMVNGVLQDRHAPEGM